jgi:hypothetical protein
MANKKRQGNLLKMKAPMQVWKSQLGYVHFGLEQEPDEAAVVVIGRRWKEMTLELSWRPRYAGEVRLPEPKGWRWLKREEVRFGPVK